MTDKDSMVILSAFLDGEETDEKKLAEALAMPGALDLLRDFVHLRAELKRDGSHPRPIFYKKMQSMLMTAPPKRKWWKMIVPVPAPALVLFVIFMTFLAVFLIFKSGRGKTHEKPPEPARVVFFEQGVDWKKLPDS
ncbi:MAG: hypothetical protein AB1756_06320 [Acidobacteriota bacterium]